jgi:hypothetical protein
MLSESSASNLNLLNRDTYQEIRPPPACHGRDSNWIDGYPHRKFQHLAQWVIRSCTSISSAKRFAWRIPVATLAQYRAVSALTCSPTATGICESKSYTIKVFILKFLSLKLSLFWSSLISTDVMRKIRRQVTRNNAEAPVITRPRTEGRRKTFISPIPSRWRVRCPQLHPTSGNVSTPLTTAATKADRALAAQAAARRFRAK